MGLSQNDKNRILDFFNQSLSFYGPQSEKAVHWLHPEDQVARFWALCNVGNLSGCTILDAGSGVGDLYEYLQKNFQDFNYLGIDIVPQMVEQARLKYPTAKFWSADLYDLQNIKFDYILASGAFSFNVAGGREFYYQLIAHLYNLCNKAMAFNMLDAAFHSSDKEYLAYHKDEVFKEVGKITPNHKLVKGYETGDFTIYLYRGIGTRDKGLVASP